jgi:chorismate dehydratase
MNNSTKSDQPFPSLRLVPPESPAELSQRYQQEQRAANRQRESGIKSDSLPFRIGSVPYLNAVPLTRGLEDHLHYAVPAELAIRLRQGELDAALLSVTEVLFHDQYDILDGIAIASLGEVKSVILAHRQPLEKVTEVYCDPASLASVNLLRVLLAEQGLRPEFKPLAECTPDTLPDFTMLIGDSALDLAYRPHDFQIYDLGVAWYELTRLPFVYAVWALQRSQSHLELRRLLREARDFGLDTIDAIISSRTEYDPDFRRDYLTWHVHYHLGADEKQGIQKFLELLQKHGLGPVFQPRYVG